MRCSVAGYPVQGASLWRVGGFQPLFVWDFTTQTAGAVVLPTGLTFARASSGHTVQNGASALVTAGITSNDIGRIGRLSSAHSYGIFVEPARTNLYGYARSGNLAPGTAGHSCSYTTGRTGPDGTTGAIRGQTPSGGYSRFQQLASLSGHHNLSIWAAAGLGTGAYQTAGPYAGTTGTAVQGTAGASWARYASTSFDYPAASTPYVNAWDGRANGTLGSAAAARDCDLDFIQFEAGKYPTSAIVTSAGSTATRAGERLSIDGTRAAASVVNGRLGVYIRLRALAASSELAATEGYLLAWAGGAVFIDGANKYIYAYNGAADSQTANNAFSCARYDSIEFAIEVGAGPTALRWKINSGSTNTANFSVQNDTLAALNLSAGLDVCNIAAAAQMPSIVEQIATFVPGRGPF